SSAADDPGTSRRVERCLAPRGRWEAEVVKVLRLTFGAAGGADLERLRSLAPSYDHVGSTLGPDPVDGVTRIEHTVHAGKGANSLAAVRDALRSWRPQRSFGMTITPADVRPDLGETVVLGLGV